MIPEAMKSGNYHTVGTGALQGISQSRNDSKQELDIKNYTKEPNHKGFEYSLTIAIDQNRRHQLVVVDRSRPRQVMVVGRKHRRHVFVALR
jgi:hypothetical protein